MVCLTSFPPTRLRSDVAMQVKQAVVGYGLAEKKQVMDMVKRLLKLKASPTCK